MGCSRSQEVVTGCTSSSGSMPRLLARPFGHPGGKQSVTAIQWLPSSNRSSLSSSASSCVATDEDRKFLKKLHHTWTDVASRTGKCGYCITSLHDPCQDAEPFAEKSFKHVSLGEHGSRRMHDCSRIGVACRKGMKPAKMRNQDSCFVLQLEDHSLCAIFDGHGPEGDKLSNFMKEVFPRLLTKDDRLRSEKEDEVLQMLKDTISRAHELSYVATSMKMVDASNSGCTATVVLRDMRNRLLFVAWVGDSGACLVNMLCLPASNRKAQSPMVQSNKLTWDHRAALPTERWQIESRGGRIMQDCYGCKRVYDKTESHPGLEISRTMGNLRAHEDAGMCAEPSLEVCHLSGGDEVLLVCSSGVWDVMTEAEASRIVCGHKPTEASKAAQAVALAAWRKWADWQVGQSTNDITVIVLYL